MAYRAFHNDSSRSLDLSPREIFEATQALFAVSGIQLCLVFIVFLTILDDDPAEGGGFTIKMPSTMSVLAARFVCSIMMHLQVVSDEQQGMNLMKYMVNHPEEFSAPRLAFVVGFLQFFVGFMTELCCIIFLGSLDNAIGVIIRFIALGSIAKVDNFYADALPSISSFKQPVKGEPVKFKAKHCYRDCRRDSPKKEDCKQKGHSHYGLARITYKLLRMFYASFAYYFMPYVAIVVPFFAAKG